MYVSLYIYVHVGAYIRLLKLQQLYNTTNILQYIIYQLNLLHYEMNP